MSVAATAAPAAPVAMQDPIRVMVVDDAVVVRGLVSRWIEEEPGLVVVASCRTGRQAVDQLLKADPDVVHLDVEQHDVGIGLEQLVDCLAAGAARGDDDEPRLFLDPARDEPADDHGVVDDHDADRILHRDWRGRRSGGGDTHERDYSVRGYSGTLGDGRRTPRSQGQISPTSWNLASTI